MVSTDVRPRRLPVLKLLKYTSASIAGVIVGQSTLFVASAVIGWSPTTSNVAAATIGAVPNYAINRYWTWNKRGRNHFRREVLPFWLLTIAGLAVSTWFVAVADDVWGTQLALQIANLAGYGSLWVVKFLVLEHLLFKAVEDPDPSVDATGAQSGG